MSPLAIIVPGPDPSRLRSALGLAAAQAALGGAVRLFLDTDAVPLLSPARPGTAQDEDGPGIHALLESCFEFGGSVMVCQTGLARAGLSAEALDPRIEFGGMVGFLIQVGDSRLIFA
jgi:predicted peroxiredoxin